MRSTRRASRAIAHRMSTTSANANKPAARPKDMVQHVFAEQQSKFRALIEKSKAFTPPIGGDANAIKAYAAKKLALLKEVRRSTRARARVRGRGRRRRARGVGRDRRTETLSKHEISMCGERGARLTTVRAIVRMQLQIPTPSERLAESMDGAFNEATTMRGFLEYAANLRGAVSASNEEGPDALRLMTQALDETEKAIGGPLLRSNAQGMATFGQKVAKATEAVGLKLMDKAALAKLSSDVDYEAIAEELAELKAIEDEANKEQE